MEKVLFSLKKKGNDMTYFEVTVEFISEIETKSGAIKEKKIKEKYLVEADSVTFAESKVNEWLKDTPYEFSVKLAKESKISAVIS